jgi:hypothetical protein
MYSTWLPLSVTGKIFECVPLWACYLGVLAQRDVTYHMQYGDVLTHHQQLFAFLNQACLRVSVALYVKTTLSTKTTSYSR